MNRSIQQWAVALLVGVFLAASVLSSSGQARRAGGREQQGGAEREPLRITKLDGLGKRAVVQTPRYSTNMSAGTKLAGMWGIVKVTYDTEPEWIDDLAFSYHVLSMTTDTPQPAYSLYRNTVEYQDIERGRDHVSTVFLRPSKIKRYGYVVAIAVEITFKGQVVAEEMLVDKDAKLPDGKWWKNPQITESKAVTVRPGCLLKRSETPFALVNIDDYEVIK